MKFNTVEGKNWNAIHDDIIYNITHVNSWWVKIDFVEYQLSYVCAFQFLLITCCINFSFMLIENSLRYLWYNFKVKIELPK